MVSFQTNQVAEYIQYDIKHIRLKHAQSRCYGLNCVFPTSKFMLKSSPTYISECDLIWKASPADVVVKMRSHWSTVSLEAIRRCLYNREKSDNSGQTSTHAGRTPREGEGRYGLG